MKCPYCKQAGDKVVDSRSSGNSIRRRRECNQCGKRFTTYEHIETVPLIVIKRDGNEEPFNREKVMSGMLNACKKRKIKLETINTIVNKIESQLADKYTREVPSEQIGEFIMSALKELDSVAYVRFASVYRSFRDITDFMSDIKKFLVNHERGAGNRNHTLDK